MKSSFKWWLTTAVALFAGAAFAQGKKTTDHQQVVHHLGIGFFGVSQVPFAPSGTSGFSSLGAPAVGARYWLNPKMGVEAALGLGFSHSGDSANDTDAGSQSTDAFLLHLGLPLALASSGHFTFEVVPEIGFGFATASTKDPTDPNTPKESGFLFSLGARAGAEIQFGFIGIPQLALQGSVGLSLQLQHASESIDALNTSVSRSAWSITTSVGDAPWELFTGNIAAIYYF